MRIVVALGGNALLRRGEPLTAEAQARNVSRASVALANLVGEHVQDTELMMAGSVLTVLPAVVVFLLFQGTYVRGILAGSIKG